MEKQNGFHAIETAGEREKLIYLSLQELVDYEREKADAVHVIDEKYKTLIAYRKSHHEQ